MSKRAPAQESPRNQAEVSALSAQVPFLPTGGARRPHHRTVDRVAQILDYMARSPEPQGLSEIANAIGAPVSSTQSLINGLTAVGYLQDRPRGFSLGVAPYLLATLAGGRPVGQVTHRMLEEVVAQTGYIAVLAVLVGGNVYYIDYAASDPSFEYLAENKLRRSPLETSAGWILLSGLSTGEAWNHLAGYEAERPGRRLRDKNGQWETLVERFQRAYPQIRKTGECLAPGVALNGADGVAVAVREHGDIVAAVSVIASDEEISREGDRILEVLRDMAPQWDS